MKTSIDLSQINQDDFESILICAERYACGRRTYMPSVVISVISPLISGLSSTTLGCMYRDIKEAREFSGLGDPKIDEPAWLRLLTAIRNELSERGEQDVFR